MSCSFCNIPIDIGIYEFVPSAGSDANFMVFFNGRYVILLTNQMIHSTQYPNFEKM